MQSRSGRRRGRASHDARPPRQTRILAAQVALDRAGFSPVRIDGKHGNNTDRAIARIQEANGLTPSAELDYADDRTPWCRVRESGDDLHDHAPRTPRDRSSRRSRPT